MTHTKKSILCFFVIDETQQFTRQWVPMISIKHKKAWWINY